MSTKRLYLGKLPADTRTDDVTKHFDGCGPTTDVRVMTGFAFIEFESIKDAEYALDSVQGKPFLGSDIVVEYAKERAPRREPYPDRDRGAPRSRRPPGIRVLVQNVHRDVSWQDLKDFGREAGQVSFADIDRNVPGQGILEYLERGDADRALRELDGKELRGMTVNVVRDESRGGADNYRRDDRERGYGGSRRDEYRGDRGSYRRDRSRSPSRRDYDDRRARSPPRRNREENGGYEERRRDDRGGDRERKRGSDSGREYREDSRR